MATERPAGGIKNIIEKKTNAAAYFRNARRGAPNV